jgi:hypothetical protein
MEVVGDVALVAAGVVLILLALDSAVRTFVLPRSAIQPVTRIVSITVRRLFSLVAHEARSYTQRDRAMALYGPILLLTLPAVWLTMTLVGYMLIYRAIDVDTWQRAVNESGSALLTLGFSKPDTQIGTLLSFTEAALGLALLALLIAYLPTIYGAFSRREVLVAKLAARGGTPPSGVGLIVRAQSMERLHLLDELFVDWQTWFAEVEESHTSLGVLSFFRSPHPDRSWITSAGAVLDAAALRSSTVELPASPNAGLCIRTGFTALRAIADFFTIPFDPDPAPTDPISVAREEFDEACERLVEAGVPVRADRDQAWADFRGWRVNYDRVLIGLAGLVMAPYAQWSSDRSLLIRVRLHRRASGPGTARTRGFPLGRRDG